MPEPSHPMQMLGSDSLLREILRRGPVVEPYNHETVAQTIAHVCKVYSEASLERDEGENGGGLFESIDNFRLIALQKLTERNVRILLAYHDSRLRQLSRINFARDDPGIGNMAAFEISFAESYSNLVGELASQISDLIDFSVDSSTPPDDLLIAVRVVKDCGLIQTEHSILHLNPNTLHFVRRRDVQHLLEQGLLVKL